MAATEARTATATVWTAFADAVKEQHPTLAARVEAAAYDARPSDDVRLLFGSKQAVVIDAWIAEQAAAEETPVRLCECGCGETVAKRSAFRQGHDQRLKGILLRRVDNGDADAAAELVDRRWRTTGEVTARLAKAARKAAEAEREAAAA